MKDEGAREGLSIRGFYKIKAVNEVTGEIVSYQEGENLVVNAGLNGIRDLITADISGGVTDEISHGALGTGTVAAAAGNTALGTETFRTDAAGAANGTGVVDFTYTMATNQPNTNTHALTELGLFNSSSGGTMFARSVFAVINKTSQVSVNVTHTLTIS